MLHIPVPLATRYSLCILLNANTDNSVFVITRTIWMIPLLCFLLKIDWISRTYTYLQLRGVSLWIRVSRDALHFLSDSACGGWWKLNWRKKLQMGLERGTIAKRHKAFESRKVLLVRLAWTDLINLAMNDLLSFAGNDVFIDFVSEYIWDINMIQQKVQWRWIQWYPNGSSIFWWIYFNKNNIGVWLKFPLNHYTNLLMKNNNFICYIIFYTTINCHICSIILWTPQPSVDVQNQRTHEVCQVTHFIKTNYLSTSQANQACLMHVQCSNICGQTTKNRGKKTMDLSAIGLNTPQWIYVNSPTTS